MYIDRYTKAVLTIIAGALLYIGAMLSGQPASAQGQAAARPQLAEDTRPQPVVVVGWGTVQVDGRVTLNMVRDANGFHTDSTLPVAVQATPQRPLPVVVQPGPRPIDVTLGATPQRPLPVAVHGIKVGADWDDDPDEGRRPAADAIPRPAVSGGQGEDGGPAPGRPSCCQPAPRARYTSTKDCSSASRACARRICASKRRVSASSTSR